MKTTLTKNALTLRSTIIYLNSNGVTGHVNVPESTQKKYQFYNCWGFTKGILDTDDEFEWFEQDAMEEWLEENTEEVKLGNLKCGDIVVFRGVDEYNCYCGLEEYGYNGEIINTPECTCEPELLHTAILVDPAQEIIIHKPGGGPLVRCTINHVEIHAPNYGQVTEYRRIKK